MSEDTTRRTFLTAAGAGVATALAGCSGNAPDEAGTDTPTGTPTSSETATATPEPEGGYTGGVLQMASPGPIQTLDPISAKGSGAGYNQYGESLMQFPQGDLPPVASLATDYEVSDDGLTYTFTLKEGVTFHDGSEMTADDVVYSWRRLAGSPNTRNADDIIGSTFTIEHDGNTGESLDNYEPGSLAVEATAEYEFQFTLATPFHASLSQIAGGAFAIIPENAVGDIEGYDGEWDYDVFFSTAGDGPTFVATGPFEVDSWSKGDQIELTAYDDYHGEGPYVDGIVYTVLSSSDAAYKRFQNENLDIMGPGSASFPQSKFDPNKVSIERDRGTYKVGTYGPMENGETVRYGEATTLESTYILFNCARTERPFRRAIAYLINQHNIADTIWKGTAEPAYHITPPGVYPKEEEGENPGEVYDKHAQDGYGSNIDFGSDGYPYGYDEARIDKAKQVMEEAGYSSDDRYQVDFTIFSGDTAWEQLAGRIRDKATSAHIEMNIQKASFGTIISKAINGEMDMFSLNDGMEWPESDNFLRFLHPYKQPGFMFTRWTRNIQATDCDFGGDSAKGGESDEVEQTLADNLDGVPASYVSAEPGGDDSDPSVTVYIKNVSKSELRSAFDAAGYTAGSMTINGADWSKWMNLADRAWKENYVPHKGPGQENQQQRNEAYVTIEECNWASVQELPIIHGISQRFWYDRVEQRMFGTMENQTYNTLRLPDNE